MEEGHPDLKVVLVGPPDSGKSSMILSLTSDAYKNISEHTPTVFDTYRAKVGDSEGQSYQLRCRSNIRLCNNFHFHSIWDTGLDGDIRKSTFPGADAIMICFPVNQSSDEMFGTLKQFAEEAKAACHNLFLVGTKTDLRGDPEETSVSLKRGIKLARGLNAIAYLECSTQDNNNSVERVFKNVAKHVSKNNKGERYFCHPG